MKALHMGGQQLGTMPLIAAVLTDSDVFSFVPKQADTADIIELRIDMFDTVTPEHIERVFRHAKDVFNKPLIATIRDTREGGQRLIENRLEIYRLIIPFADAVDVEVYAGDLLQQARALCGEHGKLLIGSYHNFDTTPQDSFLDHVIAAGRHSGADIVKIAVTAKEENDFIRLMLLTLRHRDGGIITMAMGEKGLPSRLLSPLFGSLIAYGYINKPSAPGQLSTAEVMDIFRKLKVR